MASAGLDKPLPLPPTPPGIAVRGHATAYGDRDPKACGAWGLGQFSDWERCPWLPREPHEAAGGHPVSSRPIRDRRRAQQVRRAPGNEVPAQSSRPSSIRLGRGHNARLCWALLHEFRTAPVSPGVARDGGSAAGRWKAADPCPRKRTCPLRLGG